MNPTVEPVIRHAESVGWLSVDGMTQYDRRALAQAYIDAQREYNSADGYRAAMHVYHQQILSGLQYLFDISFEWEAVDSTHRPILMMVRNTVESSLALRTPWANILEGGLIFRRLEEADALQPVLAASDQIDALVEQARTAHVTMLEALLDPMLGDRSSKVFTSEDLREIGIDDTPPDRANYTIDWDNY